MVFISNCLQITRNCIITIITKVLRDFTNLASLEKIAMNERVTAFGGTFEALKEYLAAEREISPLSYKTSTAFHSYC